MDERKRPLWPWIVAAVIGAPVLYVASFGPACWLTRQKIITSGSLEIQPPPRGMLIYIPLGKIVSDAESPASRFFAWWMTLGMGRGNIVRVPTNMRGDYFLCSEGAPD